MFCIPSLSGGSGPQTPQPKKRCHGPQPIFCLVFLRYITAFSGRLLVFLTMQRTNFLPFCRFFYDITHIKYSKNDQRAFICPRNDNDSDKRYRKINTACKCVIRCHQVRWRARCIGVPTAIQDYNLTRQNASCMCPDASRLRASAKASV